jgi:RimJ/RimL family protein N-acetyltransferase
MERLDEFGQPVGFSLPNWTPPPAPSRQAMVGRYCRLEPLNADLHSQGLYEANALAPDDRSWTYLYYGPFATLAGYQAWMADVCARNDPLFFASVIQTTGKPVGVASYLRIAPTLGSIEVGHLHYSPLLQRTPAATEAMYLMMKHAFDMGYRRYEWKCDALNGASRAAALRLGFSFEGIFRQAAVYKGRSRDTAWYAMIDGEWPTIKAALEAWLDPANFDTKGRQRHPLGRFMPEPRTKQAVSPVTHR